MARPLFSSSSANPEITVSWNWTDPGPLPSGIDWAKCTTSSQTSGRATQTLTATCTDLAGNVGTASETFFNTDTVAPVAAPTQAPAANAAGWNNTAVTVSWNWTDTGSGIDPARCTTITTSAGEGTQTLSASCTDKSGNTATATSAVKVDTVAPAAAPTQDPAANPAGWNNTPVTLTWNWTDAGSGIDPAKCTTTSTSTGEGTQTLTATCMDLAGNVGTGSYVVRVDTVAPALAPTVSQAGAGNLVQVGAAVTVSPNATDAGSGVASSSCGAAATATVGAKTLTCTATDVAGNTANATVSYTVAYTVKVLSPPTKTTFKAGSAILVQFTLTGAGGEQITTAVGLRVTRNCGAKVTFGTQAPVCAIYNPRNHTFTAVVKAPSKIAVGTVVPITIKVTDGATVLGTGSTTATAIK